MQFTWKPTPLRSSVGLILYTVVATTTKICTGHAGSREAHANSFFPTATPSYTLQPYLFDLVVQRRTIGDLLKHRPFSGLDHSAGELLHTA